MHKTILLVDHQLYYMSGAIGDLEAAGFTVIQTNGAAQAYEIMAQRHVDLLLIDSSFPGGIKEAENFISSLPSEMRYARVTTNYRLIRQEQWGEFVWDKRDIPDLVEMTIKVFGTPCHV
ncbi:MAG: hypothetical protein PHC51_07900 [bacterium]|nr:hypothetical protein [bacterium]